MFSKLRFSSKILNSSSSKLLFIQKNISNNHLIIHKACINTSSSSFNYKNRYDHFKTSDRREIFPRFYRIWVYFICGTVILCTSGNVLTLFDKLEEWIESKRKSKETLNKITHVKCESFSETEDTKKSNYLVKLLKDLAGTSKRKNKEDKGDDDDASEEIPNKKAGFRERKFIAYEDRIRAFSTPDKIFRYFATIRAIDDENGPGEIYMTPDDFLRAITPGIKQPEGLDLDSYNRYDPKTGLLWNRNQTEKLNLQISKDSVFYALGDKALISFSDFVFLLTVLSTPQRQFEIAFRMFDLNGDGELDAEEFEVVRSVVMDSTAVGKRHRDHSTTGSTLKPIGTNSALKHYFFGPEGKEKLTIIKFLEFQTKLEREIIRLEFERFNAIDGKISEIDFAKSLLVYAAFQDNKRRKLLKRIKSDSSKEESFEGITFQQYLDFHRFLKCISDVDTALTFYHMAGASIDPPTFIHVARAVADVNIAPHIVDVVFRIFDENDDGFLSNREFVSVMKNRLLRGLDRPMDTGFIRFISALFSCSISQSKLVLMNHNTHQHDEVSEPDSH